MKRFFDIAWFVIFVGNFLMGIGGAVLLGDWLAGDKSKIAPFFLCAMLLLISLLNILLLSRSGRSLLKGVIRPLRVLAYGGNILAGLVALVAAFIGGIQALFLVAFYVATFWQLRKLSSPPQGGVSAIMPPTPAAREKLYFPMTRSVSKASLRRYEQVEMFVLYGIVAAATVVVQELYITKHGILLWAIAALPGCIIVFFILRSKRKKEEQVLALIVAGIDEKEAREFLATVHDPTLVAQKTDEIRIKYRQENSSDLEAFQNDFRRAAIEKYGFNPDYINAVFFNDRGMSSQFFCDLHRQGCTPQDAAEKYYYQLVDIGCAADPFIFTKDIRTGVDIPKDLKRSAWKRLFFGGDNPSRGAVVAVLGVSFFAFLFVYGATGDVFVPSGNWVIISRTVSVIFVLSFIFLLTSKERSFHVHARYRALGIKPPGPLRLAFGTFLIAYGAYVALGQGVGALLNKITGMPGIHVHEVRKLKATSDKKVCFKFQDVEVWLLPSLCLPPSQAAALPDHGQVTFGVLRSDFGHLLVSFRYPDQ